jgi:hypothetical protein
VSAYANERGADFVRIDGFQVGTDRTEVAQVRLFRCCPCPSKL